MRILLPLGFLLALQVLDIAVHIATDQFEPLRIASNLVISLAAIAAVFLSRHSSRLLLVSGGFYLALHLLFLVQFGLTNPATGTMRVPLFVLVAGSLALTALLGRRIRP